MLAAGDFELARTEFDTVTMATNSPESMQLAGMFALCQSLVAAADKRPADIYPARMRRGPMVRDVIAGLLTRSPRDSPMGHQLRGMAYRAGLPV